MKLTAFLILASLLFPSISYSQSGWIPQPFPANKRYVEINFVENGVGFIFCSGNGTIYKTLNNGINWFSIQPEGINNINAACFTTEGLGCLIGGAIYRTTNGGWSIGILPNTNNGILEISAAKFINQDTAFACGTDFYPFPTPCCYDGVIWRTTNGGINWMEVHRAGGSFNTGLFCRDSKNIAVLNPSKIFFTTNAGTSWSEKPFTTFSQVIGWTFTNPYLDTIFIAGRDGGIIRTTDNGNNWTLSQTKSQTGPLNKIFSLDSKNVYAVGDTGKIFYTSNAGNSWIRQNSGTAKNLNSVWFLSRDTGYVCGDSGIVLKTFTRGLTSAVQISENVPGSFLLEQNYPNPFNPSTEIKFSLRTEAFVSLKVYNVNGAEVSELVNENKDAGYYSVSFSAQNLPSGIYFYKLTAGNFSDVKKMMVVK